MDIIREAGTNLAKISNHEKNNLAVYLSPIKKSVN